MQEVPPRRVGEDVKREYRQPSRAEWVRRELERYNGLQDMLERYGKEREG